MARLTQVDNLGSRSRGGEISGEIYPMIPVSPEPPSPRDHPSIGHYGGTVYDHRAFDEYMKFVQQFQTAASTTISESIKAKSVGILRRV